MAEIRRSCHRCDGDGVIENPAPGENATCPECNGSGRLPTVIEVSDLMDELSDIKTKVLDNATALSDIWEKINE